MHVTWSVVALLGASAFAQDGECGVPFGEFELRELVTRSDDALLKDDVVAHGRLFTEFRTRVPCLVGQLPKDAWARLLLNEAIVRRVQGRPWAPLLDVALDAYSDLVVPSYLMQEFSPAPPAQDSGKVLPSDATLFLDGSLIPYVPVLTGEHVVQVWRDRRWRSVYLEDAPVPAEWIAPTVVAAPIETGPVKWKPSSRGTVGAALGPGPGRQFVSVPADWLGDQQAYAFTFGVTSAGVLPIVDLAGVYWDAAFGAQVVSLRDGTDGVWGLDRPTVIPQVFVGPTVVLEEVTVGVGGGFVTLPRYEGEIPIVGWYPMPDVAVTVRRDRADFGVDAGVTPAALHAGLSAGSLSDTERDVALRVGVDADLGVAWLREEEPGARQASALLFVTAIRLDAAWGRDR